MRLHQYQAAQEYLTVILQRNPTHERALYLNAFCQRSQGQQRDAIAGLTKVSAVAVILYIITKVSAVAVIQYIITT